jgi:hypothetical protein
MWMIRHGCVPELSWIWSEGLSLPISMLELYHFPSRGRVHSKKPWVSSPSHKHRQKEKKKTRKEVESNSPPLSLGKLQICYNQDSRKLHCLTLDAGTEKVRQILPIHLSWGCHTVRNTSQPERQKEPWDYYGKRDAQPASSCSSLHLTARSGLVCVRPWVPSSAPQDKQNKNNRNNNKKNNSPFFLLCSMCVFTFTFMYI